MRAATLALLLAALAPAVRADEPAKPVENRVELNKVGVPIVWDGRVVNYVFVTCRLKTAPGRDAQALREKEPYLRDALVRAAHRTPFVDPHDLSRADERAINAFLLREGERVAGRGAFTEAVVFAQAPLRRSGLPRADGAPPAPRPIIP